MDGSGAGVEAERLVRRLCAVQGRDEVPRARVIDVEIKRSGWI